MKCIIPGSYDPVTAGHADIIGRAAAMFDEVYAVIFDNSEKHGCFSPETRLEALRETCARFANVRVYLSSALLADYMTEHGITVIVKGARNATDFDYEYWLSLINRSFDPKIETIILPSRAELQHISSTMVRELIKYGKPLDGYVPDPAIPVLKAASVDK